MNNIEILPWNKNFECGIVIIDSQHMRLVELVNILVNHLVLHIESPELHNIFNELKEYASVHFETEEAIWETYLDGDIFEQEHKETHNSFLAKVLEFEAQKDLKSFDDIIEEIVIFLTHWLALHIIDSDKRMSKLVGAIDRGATIEEAKIYADEQMSGETKTTIETIMTMFDKLATRTVDLSREISKRREAEIKLNNAMAELRAATEAAETANKAKSDFLANMSHEIRTPLNSIIGMTYTLFQSDLPDEQLSYVKKISVAGESLIEIVNDILDYSKIDAGKVEIENVSFNLCDVVGKIVSLFGVQAEEKGIKLVVGVSDEVPTSLVGDPTRLGQVLINLCSNAIKFTKRGKVSLNIETLGNENGQANLRFSIADTGIGMSQDQLAKLYEPFTQGDSSISRKFGGTGLGLAISKSFVEMMGGSIDVSSETDKGTEFIVNISMTYEDGAECSSGISFDSSDAVNILDLQGVNTKAGLESCEDNHEEYVSKLLRFHFNMKDYVARFYSAVNNNDQEEALTLISMLKESAGDICAMELFHAASMLENQCIRDCMEQEKINPLLNRAYKELEFVMTGLHKLAGERGSGEQLSEAEAISKLKEIRDVVEDYDTAALAMVDRLIKQYINEKYSDEFDSIQKLLKGYSFDEALDVLDNMLGRIRG